MVSRMKTPTRITKLKTREQAETLRDAWIEALRSGEYQQGEGLLKEYDYYCCLGVLCDVSGGDDELERAQETGAELIQSHVWANFVSLLGHPKVSQDSLARHNDGGVRHYNNGERKDIKRKDFREIATIIKKRLG